ncbi:MAG: nitronate monooxygenase [Halobacteriota archaeon]|nr:nitronate monooxygenase [Halobacteriota archaeon]
MIKTRLTELIGIKHPIIQAGMGPFSTNQMCANASNAGALGLISTSGLASQLMAPEMYNIFIESTPGAKEAGSPLELYKVIYRSTLEKTRETKGYFGSNIMVSEELRGMARKLVEVLKEIREESKEMEERANVVITSAGDPVKMADLLQDSGMVWGHVVPSVKHATRAVKAGVNFLVVSGQEGGFHGPWEPISSMTLLPAVCEEFPDVPAAGTGGFCDGRTLAAALALGADGVQMGTRFLATKDCEFADMWKNQVVETGDRGTLRARGMVGPARYLKTPVSQEICEVTIEHAPGTFTGVPDTLTSIPTRVLMAEMKGFAATFAGEEDKALFAGGECAQRIKDMPTAAELVERTVKEAEEALRSLKEKYPL